ncbi:hypothetical protein KAU11_11145 [Candidatus Babeliales bacterium]|nr:hypothetical protein [Candidatus Babeliales bacterium]
MTQQEKPFKEILEEAQKDALKQLGSWKSHDYVFMKIDPPDILALTNTLEDILKVAPSVELPMTVLKRVASIFQNSEDVEKSSIGAVLIECIEEIQNLTNLCISLDNNTVKYPEREPKEPEEE